MEKMFEKPADSSSGKQGEIKISAEALTYLTHMFGFEEISKKQIEVLSRAILMISKKNIDYWNLVHKKFREIGIENLDQINMKLKIVLGRF